MTGKKLYQGRFRIQSARLKNWDYGSPGLYFVTINAIDRHFGQIVCVRSGVETAGGDVGAGGVFAIRGYKAGVKTFATTNGIPFAWQPRFYDHIVRTTHRLIVIRDYIKRNPISCFHKYRKTIF